MPYSLSPITNVLDVIEPLYDEFSLLAQTDYAWPGPMVPFELFKSFCQQGIFQGYVASDVLSKEPVAMLVLETTDYGVIEPRICHIRPTAPKKTVIDAMFRQFTKDLGNSVGWKSVSFSLLGPAMRDYAQYLNWYGFTPVAQAVVEFDLLNPTTAQVFQCVEHPPLPAGMKLLSWPEAKKTVSMSALGRLIYEAFSQSVDARWDPRFWQPETMGDVIRYITEGAYGEFHAEATQLLVDAKRQPIGFCFLSQIGPSEANIPLVGVSREYRNQKLGPILVAAVLRRVIQQVMSQQLFTQIISATVATENAAAIRLYRGLGFCEKHWYPHMYLTPELLRQHQTKPVC